MSKINYINIKEIKKFRDITRTFEWKEIREAILELFPYCLKCKSKNKLHIDHIKPISKFPKYGLNYKNLQVLCAECNIIKSNKTTEDYRDNDDVISLHELFIERNFLRYQSMYHKRWHQLRKGRSKRRIKQERLAKIKIKYGHNAFNKKTNEGIKDVFNKTGKKVIVRKKGLQDKIIKL